MPAAVAIPLIVGAASTAATVYGAKKSADASKNAARTQTAAGDQALGLQRDMYQQQQANLAPYRALGNGSLGNLGNFQSFAGVPGSFGAGVQAQYQRPLSPGFQAPHQQQPQGQQPTMGQPAVDHAIPRRGMLGMVRGMAQQPASVDMVRMRAPNGEEQHVPSAQVEHYRQLGAQVVQ